MDFFGQPNMYPADTLQICVRVPGISFREGGWLQQLDVLAPGDLLILKDKKDTSARPVSK